MREAVSQQRMLQGKDDFHTAIMYRDLARQLGMTGNRDSLLVMLREVEAILREKPDNEARLELANTLLLIKAQLPIGEFEKQEAMLVEANEIFESLDTPGAMQRALAAKRC